MNGIGYKIKKTILYILLILLSVVCMFPFLLMIVNATRSGSEIMKSFTLIPSVYLKENWATVFKYFNLFLGMWNSLKVAVPSTLLCAYFSAMTAYALAMYKFKGNKVLFMTILIFMMIPGQLGLIGFYNLCTKLHLVNSYIPLIIPAIASPGTVFFLRQYVLSVMPPSLIEAARIDGAGPLTVLLKVYLPISLPALATVGLFAIVNHWNDFFSGLVYMNKTSMYPLQTYIQQLSVDMSQITDPEQLKRFAQVSNKTLDAAKIVVSTIPLLIIYPFLQKYFVSGIVIGAVKE